MNACRIQCRNENVQNGCYAVIHDSLLLDAPLTTRQIVQMCRIWNKRTNNIYWLVHTHGSRWRKMKKTQQQQAIKPISKRFVFTFCHLLAQCYCCLLLGATIHCTQRAIQTNVWKRTAATIHTYSTYTHSAIHSDASSQTNWYVLSNVLCDVRLVQLPLYRWKKKWLGVEKL